jgi:hypothetical protein
MYIQQGMHSVFRKAVIDPDAAQVGSAGVADPAGPFRFTCVHLPIDLHYLDGHAMGKMDKDIAVVHESVLSACNLHRKCIVASATARVGIRKWP